MILADTNVWIDFIKGKKPARPLADLLSEKNISGHPWIYGELMLGQLGPLRRQILADYNLLPMLPIYMNEDLDEFVEREKLYGKGLSFIDIQLLYTAIVEDCFLWTFDKGLHQTALKYGKAFAGSGGIVPAPGR